MAIDRKEIELAIRARDQSSDSLKKIAKNIDDLAKAVDKSSEASKRGENTTAALTAQQKALSSEYAKLARLIAKGEQFEALSAKLEQTKQKAAAAQASLAQLNAKIAESGQATKKQEAEQARLAKSLALANAQVDKQVIKLQQLEVALTASGVDTRNLNALQQQAVVISRQYGEAINKSASAQTAYATSTRTATAATKQQAVAQEQANKEMFKLGSSDSRTSLSFMQRMRGEALSLAANYAGLYSTLQLAGSALDAFNTKQGVKNQLALSVGDDPEKIAQEYEYIRQQADRIGIAFEGAAQGYTKFAAAAALAGRNQQEIRYVFEAFSEVGRVANLTEDNMNGVFKALEQIYSKGKIQAEELRGQLGDRLFGAFQIAAQALKDQFPDLNKALKDGEVSADQLLAIAEKYRETVSTRLTTATDSLAANQKRLNSAVFDFKVLVAESGFADDYARLTKAITDFLQSDDGKEFAKGIADAFSTVVDLILWIIENKDGIVDVITAVASAYAAVKVVELGSGLVNLARGFTLVTKSVEGYLAVMGGVGFPWLTTLIRLTGILTAAWAGWELGEWARENFPAVERLGTAMAAGIHEAFIRLEGWFKRFDLFVTSMFTNWRGPLGEMVKWLAEVIKKIPGIGESAADGLLDLAEKIDPNGEAGAAYTAALERLRKETEDEVSKMQAVYGDMMDEAGKRSSAATKKPGASAKPTAKPASSTPTGAVVPRAVADPFMLEKDEIDRKLRDLEQAYKTANVSTARYYEERLALQSRAIDNEIAEHERNLSTIEAKETEKRSKELAEIEILKRKKSDLAKESAIEQAETEKKLAEELNSLRIKAMKEESATFTERWNAVYEKYRDQLERMVIDGNEAGVQIIENLINIEALDGRLKELDERFKADLAEFNQERQLSAQMKTGNRITDSMLYSAQDREKVGQKIEDVKASADYKELQNAAAGGSDQAIKKLAEWDAALKKLGETSKTTFTLIMEESVKMFAGGFADAVEKVIDGTMSMREAFDEMVRNFVTQVAKMIVQAMAMYAVISLINMIPGGTAITAAMGFATKAHSGAVIGRSGGTQVQASPALFAGAPRYHTGGIVGLAPDEYPAILQENEEVLAKGDPRNILNGGAAAGVSQRPQDIKIINQIDSASVLREALNTAEGQKSVINFMRANQKQVMGTLA